MKQTGFQTALYGLRPSEQFVRQQEGFPHRNDAVCLNVADDAGQFAHNKYSGPIAGCLSGKENRLDNAAVKPNYVPLLMVLLVLGAPVGAVCAVLMLAAFGWVPLGTWRGWLDFPYSLYFLATGWFIGLIPALSTLDCRLRADAAARHQRHFMDVIGRRRGIAGVRLVFLRYADVCCFWYGGFVVCRSIFNIPAQEHLCSTCRSAG